jgi:hypothetical protein
LPIATVKSPPNSGKDTGGALLMEEELVVALLPPPSTPVYFHSAFWWWGQQWLYLQQEPYIIDRELLARNVFMAKWSLFLNFKTYRSSTKKY